jgi:hypothetical protein
MRAGYRLLRTPWERKQADRAGYRFAPMARRGLRDQMNKMMRSA